MSGERPDRRTRWAATAAAHQPQSAALHASDHDTPPHPPPAPSTAEGLSTAGLRASSGSAAASSAASADARPPPYFSSHAIDHAVAGVGAGIAATVCMNPLDLIKVKFQIDTRPVRPLSSLSFSGITVRDILTGGRVGREMGASLRDIVRDHGWSGLYRGLGPNVIGNSTSWGLYFLWYTMIKESMSSGKMSFSSKGESSSTAKLSAGQHLLAASISGGATALLTNPIWVVKTRMFATPPPPRGAAKGQEVAPSAPQRYRTTWGSLVRIYREEGIRGLYKGGGLALVGVSNGAIQFTAYEQLKKWRSRVAIRRQNRRQGIHTDDDSLIPEGGVKLSNTEYILVSGASKIVAIFLTYPYQVVRSRIQNTPASLASASSSASAPSASSAASTQASSAVTTYTSIPDCIRKTYTHEGGIRAFYKGLTANCVRVIPGTCVTFVVYEQIAWALKGAAAERARQQGAGAQASAESES